MADLSENIYIVAIAVLLPVTATMTVTQRNPYHALVIRGILGAVAALVYALFGAADVALTEALVGTMLSITLYAIAVRSSMSLRLGVWVPDGEAMGHDAPGGSREESVPVPLRTALQAPLQKYHLRLEQVPYPSLAALNHALQNREVHAIYGPLLGPETLPQLHIRLQRLYDLLHGSVPPELAIAVYTPVNPAPEPPPAVPAMPPANSLEVTP
ncbi:MAG: DUF4040 domain-containing protein [Cyanobacteria bacterium]|nr:DUF4040 domain-containing protein [Cyanobacteriota bacterium]